ncbi:MAG: DNA/RNA non-specific endonuclease [Muribaculaceae bacterium]|nr:DNA/RNA non-specific endonuclease [Muribaculaceae bacterium]
MVNKNQIKRYLQWAAWVLVAALLVVLYTRNDGDNMTDDEQSKIMSGEGSNADLNYESVVLPRGLSDRVVKYKGYTAHFNKELHIPNCVTYEITANETRGRQGRKGQFERDESVAGCPNWWDYRDSGYERGHMAPAGDMKWDDEAMNETFYLTNVCPQDASLNGGVWNDIEMKVREWARRDKSLFVVTGPIMGKNPETIGQDMDIAVPEAFFKVILSPSTTPMKAIGFICPNRPCGGVLRSYAVSVDEVEERTGINFFNVLPDDVENTIESSCNFNQWLNR